MEVIILNTFKVASRLPLSQIASYFSIKQDALWKEYITINNEEIEKILMYSSKYKTVYLYKYGCITFVNFKYHEIQSFLEYLAKIYVELDNKLIARFTETHIMTISKGGEIKISEDLEKTYDFNKNIIHIAATVLAKSVELNKIEAELDIVLDEAGHLIKYLNRGRLRANSRNVISIIARCTRYKFRTIESVRLLDRPSELDNTIENKNIFEDFSSLYELHDRYSAMANRTHVLDSITEEYFGFKNSQSERRRLMFEIFLLAIFPLMYFI